MVEVSIQHIIGTVALIGLVISSGLFYTVFTSYVQDSNRRKELEQISATVALNLEYFRTRLFAQTTTYAS